MSIRHHLTQLGLDADTILAHLPSELTLSLQDGVLFVSDKKNQYVHVDFLSGKTAYRAAQHTLGEHLIKACRIKNIPNIKVLDATCGMGRDSFLLFQSGFEVTACEKHPVIHALLKDGLNRYSVETEVLPFCLHQLPAEQVMESQAFDVIYLDPMFPQKIKSAKAKKDMQLFQSIHQNTEDNAESLLRVALNKANKRVVIKRPLRSEHLLSKKPTFQIMGKTCRFDAFQLA